MRQSPKPCIGLQDGAKRPISSPCSEYVPAWTRGLAPQKEVAQN